MSLSEADVEKIAKLARLALSQTQNTQLRDDLVNILNLAEKMNSVDTAQVATMAHPLDIYQPTREDKITETNQRDLFQSIAPDVSYGLYLVPAVIE